MVKIICTTLEGGSVQSNSYKATPSGQTYPFHRGSATEVKDAKDALFFLNAGGGKIFQPEGARDKVIAALKKKVDPAKKEEPEGEADDPGAEAEKEEKTAPKVDSYTKLKRLDKDEQLKLIRKLDPDAKKPKTEDLRIEKIQELQRGGN